MEYNFIGFVESKTVTYYPFDIYCYYLGREGQSVLPASMKKNVFQHEKVTMRLVEEYEKRKDTLPLGKQKYIFDKLLVHLCKTQYIICTEYFNGNEKFLSFDKKLKNYPEIYNNNKIVGKRIKLYRKTHGLLIWANFLLKRIGHKKRKNQTNSENQTI